MDAIMRRNNSHPIVISRCAILNENTRLWISANRMHSSLLHNDVIVLSDRQNVQIREATRAVLHEISEVLQIISEHHVGHVNWSFPIVVEACPSDR